MCCERSAKDGRPCCVDELLRRAHTGLRSSSGRGSQPRPLERMMAALTWK
jgi:hypothetical protein